MEAIFDFLNDLKGNNNREWFAENKVRYTSALKQFEDLVGKLIHVISQFDDSVVHLEPKDCIFRIYKDVRFSKNKDPYKTNFGAYISRGGRKGKFAGYYIHLQPGESFLSGGVYMPDPAILKRVREDIDLYLTDFEAIVEKKTFKRFFPEVMGDKLKTVPKGYDKENPAAELLKHKDYYVMHFIPDGQIYDPNFVGYASEVYQQLLPFNHFFNRAIADM